MHALYGGIMKYAGVIFSLVKKYDNPAAEEISAIIEGKSDVFLLPGTGRQERL